LTAVEIEGRRERVEAREDHPRGERARDVEREVADPSDRVGALPGRLTERTERADQDRVGRLLEQVTIDLLLARLPDPRGGQTDPAPGSLGPERAERRARAGEREEVEVDAGRARVERRTRLVGGACQHEETGRELAVGPRRIGRRLTRFDAMRAMRGER